MTTNLEQTIKDAFGNYAEDVLTPMQEAWRGVEFLQSLKRPG